MTKKQWRILGFVVLGVGIITLLFSVQAAHRAVEQLYQEITGRHQSHRWYIILGIILVLGGLFCTFFPFKKK